MIDVLSGLDAGLADVPAELSLKWKSMSDEEKKLYKTKEVSTVKKRKRTSRNLAEAPHETWLDLRWKAVNNLKVLVNPPSLLLHLFLTV